MPTSSASFEVAPLVAHVRSLLVRARPLLPGDVALPNKTTQSADEAVSADRARVAAVKQIADALEPDLGLFLADLEPLLADQPNRRADLIAGIDDFVDRAVGLLERAARLRPSRRPAGASC